MRRLSVIPLLLLLILRPWPVTPSFQQLPPFAQSPASAASIAASRALRPPSLTAWAAFLLDDITGRTLYSSNADALRYPASTAKMPTAIVAAKRLTPSTVVIIPADAVADPSVFTSARLSAGERMPVSNLLYGLLLPSGNDAALALAERISGSNVAFAGLMNQEARRLHLWHSHFLGARGTDTVGQYSTARDLAWLAHALLRKPTLARIVRTRTYHAVSIDGRYVHDWTNLNGLLGTYPGAIGVKTGTTPLAGANLVAAATRNNHRLIAVVLGSTASARFSDGTKLLNYGWRLLDFRPRQDARLARSVGATPVASQQPTPSIVATSVPTPPNHLTQLMRGNAIAPGSWINQQAVQIQFGVTGAGSSITPEVELRPLSQPLTGRPTNRATTIIPSTGKTQIVSLTITGLHPSTRYRWRARVVDGNGSASTWVTFRLPDRVTHAFAIDTRAPSMPAITSTTNPHSGWWYNTHVERFSWGSQDTESGLAGYSVRVDRAAGGNPNALTQQSSLTVSNLSDGRWVLHVWARDSAGNWSGGSVYRFNLDTTPPKIAFVSTSTHDFNPYLGTSTWRYTIDQWAHVVVDIRRSGQKAPVLVKDLGSVKPGTQMYTWDGKTQSGQLAAAGWYWFHVTATDGVGNPSNRAFGGIHVRPVIPVYKRIVISLSQQTIAAYQNGRLVYSSLATTGNFQLSPTPAGHYHIFAKYSPYQFVSPWPPGDPLWYESAWSSYAMEFISGGYFIHDAPWRNVFGPASQAGGRPGTDYGGTHGCVNAPPATAAFLWNWAPIGTDVDVM